MPRYRFTDIAINSTAKKKPTEEDKYTYIGLEHLDSGSLEVTRWGSDVAPVGEKLLMKKGDVLFGKRRAYQKKVGIAPFDGIFSAHGMVLRPRENVITKEYFPLFISSDYFLDEAIRISVGSLSPTVNWKDLKDLEFNIPTIEDQKKIAPVIWAAIAVKTAYKAQIQATDDLVKSQFIELSNDASCAEYRMGDLATYINGFAFKPKDWSIDGDPIIRIQNLNDHTAPYNYHSGEIAPKYRVVSGDVLVSWATHLEAYIWNGPDAWLNQHIFKVVFDKLDIDKTFYIYTANAALQEAFKKAHGFKATMEHIKRGDFEGASVFVPSKEKQIQFSAFAQQADKSKFELQQAIEKIDSLVRSLIQ